MSAFERPCGDQLEDLQLALRQLRERRPRASARPAKNVIEPGRDRCPEDRLADRGRPDRRSSSPGVGVLRDVAARAGPHRREERIVVLGHRQDRARRPTGRRRGSAGRLDPGASPASGGPSARSPDARPPPARPPRRRSPPRRRARDRRPRRRGRAARRDRRGWSSAIRTRIGASVDVSGPLAARGQARPGRRATTRVPPPGDGLDRQLAADLGSPARASPASRRRSRRPSTPRAVVDHLDLELVVVERAGGPRSDCAAGVADRRSRAPRPRSGTPPTSTAAGSAGSGVGTSTRSTGRPSPGDASPPACSRRAPSRPSASSAGGRSVAGHAPDVGDRRSDVGARPRRIERRGQRGGSLRDLARAPVELDRRRRPASAPARRAARAGSRSRSSSARRDDPLAGSARAGSTWNSRSLTTATAMAIGTGSTRSDDRAARARAAGRSGRSAASAAASVATAANTSVARDPAHLRGAGGPTSGGSRRPSRRGSGRASPSRRPHDRGRDGRPGRGSCRRRA